MAQPDLERVHSVTDNFFFWQGLRFVPVGATLLLLSASYASWWPIEPRYQSLVLLAALAFGVALSMAAGAYYARAYGRVTAAPGAHARRSAVKWLVVYPALAAAMVIDGVLRPAVFLSGIVWGAATLAYWSSTGRGRSHYLGATLLMTSTAAWPAMGVAERGPSMLNLFLGVVGGIYIVSGILDHLELRRLLPPLPRNDD